MCGIAGIIDLERRFSADSLLSVADAMGALLRHRGPDQNGVWLSPGGYCAFSHRRLSIIDLSEAGRQPMVSDDGRRAITFNGELYSYLEERERLTSMGVAFRTRTDTEVFLRGLDKEGPAFLSRLDAMYAIGHYDSDTRTLLLARDGFGEKPLYYTRHGGLFAFASELHALTALPDFDPTIDDSAIASYLAFQYLPTSATIYRSVRRLQPGCHLSLSADGATRIARHAGFVTASGRVDPRRGLDDLADELEELLLAALRRRLVADVPLGAFLSGGVDSSLVCALISKRMNRELKTFSIGFRGAEDSEHAHARKMADHLGTQHHERLLEPEILGLARHVGEVLDEPNGDSSCLPTYLLSEFARETVTVGISGDGADELFGGYGRYFATVDEDERRKRGDPELDWWSAGQAYFGPRMLVFPLDALTELFPRIPMETALAVTALKQRLDNRDKALLDTLREVDAETYMPGAVLPKVDRMSMRHALEVRTPYLAPEVAAFASRLSASQCYDGSGQGKLVLKRLAQRYIPLEWLTRRKMGFGLPMTAWGKETLLPMARSLLLDRAAARLSRWIPHDRLSTFLAKQKREFAVYRVWEMVILEIWLRSHAARPG